MIQFPEVLTRPHPSLLPKGEGVGGTFRGPKMPRKTSEKQPVVKAAEKVDWRSEFLAVFDALSPPPPVFRSFGTFWRDSGQMSIQLSRFAVGTCELDRVMGTREQCTTWWKVMEHVSPWDGRSSDEC